MWKKRRVKETYKTKERKPLFSALFARVLLCVVRGEGKMRQKRPMHVEKETYKRDV